MKIFDFSSGHVGQQLSVSRRPSFCASMPVRNRHFINFVAPRQRDSEWCLHSAAGWGDEGAEQLITPEQYGVEAVAFCIGQCTSGTDRGTWSWCVVGTDAWVDKALATGLLTPRNPIAADAC